MKQQVGINDWNESEKTQRQISIYLGKNQRDLPYKCKCLRFMQ